MLSNKKSNYLNVNLFRNNLLQAILSNKTLLLVSGYDLSEKCNEIDFTIDGGLTDDAQNKWQYLSATAWKHKFNRYSVLSLLDSTRFTAWSKSPFRVLRKTFSITLLLFVVLQN